MQERGESFHRERFQETMYMGPARATVMNGKLELAQSQTSHFKCSSVLRRCVSMFEGCKVQRNLWLGIRQLVPGRVLAFAAALG